MSTFVGRVSELQKLNYLLKEARQNCGSVVLLSGEAGIGKSALVDYFLAKYATDMQVFRSRCNEQYGEGSAFLPWIEILTDIISDKDSEGKPIASKLLSIIKDTLGPWMGVVPVVGSIIAAVWETGKSVKTQFRDKSELVKDRYTRDDFYQSFVTTLQKVGELSPIVLFIDDLHWSDASSIGLLRWITEKIATLPVLIIGAYRPSDINVGRGGIPHPLKDAIHEMHARHRLWTILDLDGLSQDLVDHYLKITFPQNMFTTTLVTFLYDVTDGNPFFLEQYVQLLKEQGHLIQRDGKWKLACDFSVIENEIPRDVQSVIQKRLDRLHDDIMKNVLLYGSAEGEEFTSFVLSRLMGWESLPPIERLNLLTRIKQQLVETHRLLLERGTLALPKTKKTTKYQFVHTVLHKVLYNGLSYEQREILHQSIGECLESEFEGREIEIAEKLAFHFAQSGNTKKAIDYLLGLAETKNGNLGTPGVELYCQQALDLVKQLEDTEELRIKKVNLLIEMARAKLVIGSKTDDIEAYEFLRQAENLAKSVKVLDLFIKLDYWWGWAAMITEQGDMAFDSYVKVFQKGQEKINISVGIFRGLFNDLESYPEIIIQLERLKQNIDKTYNVLNNCIVEVLRDIDELPQYVYYRDGYLSVLSWWHQGSFNSWMRLVNQLVYEFKSVYNLINKQMIGSLSNNLQKIERTIIELSFLPHI